MTKPNAENVFVAISKILSEMNDAEAYRAFLAMNMYYFIRYVNLETIDTAWDDIGVIVKKAARDPDLIFILNSGEIKGNA